MRIWIDLANSPHAMLFGPLIERLEDAQHEVLLTARDHAQTVEIARDRWGSRVEVVGTRSPGAQARKAATMVSRAAVLLAWTRRNPVDLALSHNSYAQIAAARLRRLSIVTAMDFEHQPANHLAFRLAGTIVVPEALRGTCITRQGATAEKTSYYPGLKEEIYLGLLESSPAVLEEATGGQGRKEIVVVGRTPPVGAAYHPFENELFYDCMRELGTRPDTTVIVLARHPEQRAALAALNCPNLHVPRRALDSLALMYEADLVLGAGGTMTREAALLGVPTFSLFQGRAAAVDDWLVARGLLQRLTSVQQLVDARPRIVPPREPMELRRRAEEVMTTFLRPILAV